MAGGLAPGFVLNSQGRPAARPYLWWVRCVIRTARLDSHRTVVGWTTVSVSGGGCGMVGMHYGSGHGLSAVRVRRILSPTLVAGSLGGPHVREVRGRLQALHLPCPALALQGGWLH